MSEVNSGEVKVDETDKFVVVNSDAPVAPVEEVKQVEGAEAKAPEGTSETKTTDESGVKGESATGENDNTTGDNLEDDVKQDADKSKKTSRGQKRIDKITREREDERRKNENLQRQIDELKNGKAGSEQEAPKESDFDTYDEYLNELDKFDGQSDDKGKAEKPANDQQTVQLNDSQLTAQAILREKIEENIDKYENFEGVALSDDVAITPEMVESLAECDDPLKVMYHLGQNKELAKEIAGKTPAQQSRAIANLDFTVKVAPPKPANTTNAADPISPVHGSESQQKAIGDMSFSEYEAHQNKIEAEKRTHG